MYSNVGANHVLRILLTAHLCNTYKLGAPSSFDLIGLPIQYNIFLSGTHFD